MITFVSNVYAFWWLTLKNDHYQNGRFEGSFDIEKCFDINMFRPELCDMVQSLYNTSDMTRYLNQQNDLKVS